MAAGCKHGGVQEVLADMTPQRLLYGEQAGQRSAEPVCRVGDIVGVIFGDRTRDLGVHVGVGRDREFTCTLQSCARNRWVHWRSQLSVVSKCNTWEDVATSCKGSKDV